MLLLLLLLLLLLRMLWEDEDDEAEEDEVADKLWLVASLEELLLLLLALPLSVAFSPPIGTRGGMSLGGTVLKPGLELESRPDSPLEPLLPREEGRFSCSDLSAASLSFLSSGGMMGLEGDGSLPMLLQV